MVETAKVIEEDVIVSLLSYSSREHAPTMMFEFVDLQK